jgi:hypothetical protein
MGHLEITVAEAIFMAFVGSLIFWAPLFGLAYARRRFGGEARNYAMACLATAAASTAAFVLLGAIEAAGR